jgi:pimeloyl-ACP methyl ester carboxylesterase
MTGEVPRRAARALAARAVRTLAGAADYAYVVRRQVVALLGRHDPSRYAAGTRTPVLLIPGIYETWVFLEPLARALHDAGHPVHTVPGLGYNRRDLASSASIVEDRLDELRLDRVVLVAHSKGGLIGKNVMARPRAARRVAGLVALNTPFGGSVYAAWFPARPVRSLAPRHPDLVALGLEVDPHPRIVSVYSRFDPHVPAGSALAGAVNVPLPQMGHFRVVGMPGVRRTVVEHVATFDPASGPGRGRRR